MDVTHPARCRNTTLASVLSIKIFRKNPKKKRKGQGSIHKDLEEMKTSTERDIHTDQEEREGERLASFADGEMRWRRTWAVRYRTVDRRSCFAYACTPVDRVTT